MHVIVVLYDIAPCVDTMVSSYPHQDSASFVYRNHKMCLYSDNYMTLCQTYNAYYWIMSYYGITPKMYTVANYQQ